MKKILTISLLLITSVTFAQTKTVIKVQGQPGIYGLANNTTGDSLIFYSQGVRHAIPVTSNVDLSNYYDKSEVDNSLNGKLAISDTASMLLPYATELGTKLDTSYKQSITAIKPLHWNIITPDSATIGLYVDTTSDLSDGNDTTVPSTKAIKSYVDNRRITPNLFKGLGLNDVEKIQRALNLAVNKNLPLYIDSNEESGSNIWLLDSAILLSSNTNITIQNATLKLSDSSRDNVFRTANSGIGIGNPQDNPMKNITITGIGNAVIQGADNPRATGDAGKTLTLTPDNGANSYGTDAGKAGRVQTGDWRNYGIIFAYSKNIKVSGLTLYNLHGWSMDLERDSGVIIRDMVINNNLYRSFGKVKNTDGIDIRNGCRDLLVENITIKSGDDAVALVTLQGFSSTPAGTVPSYMVTSMVADTLTDNIENFTIKNVYSDTRTNTVRLLNTGGLRIYNGTINNILDIVPTDSLPDGSMIVMGAVTGSYAGPTPIGNIRNINISNVVCNNYPYAINIQGSIAESSISNIIKNKGVNPAIYFNPASFGARNLTVSNAFDSTSTDLAAVRSGSTAQKAGIIRSAGIMTVVDDSVRTGLKYKANYGVNFTARSLVDKGYTDSAVAAAGGGTTTNSVTFNNSNTGATSGTTFNGSAAKTISANTLGAAALGVANIFTQAQTITDGLGTAIINGAGFTFNRNNVYLQNNYAGGFSQYFQDKILFKSYSGTQSSIFYGDSTKVIVYKPLTILTASDAIGDIVTRNNSTGLTNIRTAAETLSDIGALPVLAPYIAKASSYTALATDRTIEVTATGQTITLPTAVGITGKGYIIKLTASGTATVATTSSQTIDGSTTYSLPAQYKYVTVQSNGANWIIIGNN